MNKFCLSLLTAAGVLLSFAPRAAHAQQSYVGRYDAYVGFTDINAPALGLNQDGFHTQVGFKPPFLVLRRLRLQCRQRL